MSVPPLWKITLGVVDVRMVDNQKKWSGSSLLSFAICLPAYLVRLRHTGEAIEKGVNSRNTH
jgi:hypothetical protein